MSAKIKWIEASWPEISGFHALTTLRGDSGGVSSDKFTSLNLGINDSNGANNAWLNRSILQQSLNLTSPIYWMTQKHTNLVLNLDKISSLSPPPNYAPIADACFTSLNGCVCAVLTADCVPILLRSSKKRLVCAIHAGWRGLVNGVIENALGALNKIYSPRGGICDLEAWIGPCISLNHFETSAAVTRHFLNKDSDFKVCCKQRIDQKLVNLTSLNLNENTKYHIDLPKVAKLILLKCQITNVYGGDQCTFSEPSKFYSYRRDSQTGRMASLIWMD